MPEGSQPSQSVSEISENATAHMAYLVRGDDPARPDDCELCAELRDAGLLEFVRRPHVRAKWWVRSP